MFGKKKEKEYQDMNEEEKKNYLKTLEDRQKREEEKRKVERENFLESILKRINGDFEEFKGGYRITSFEPPEVSGHLLDNKMLSEITNRIKDKYNCKLHSFSVSETSVSGKTYYFMFEK